MKIFISYSREDKAFVESLHTDLGELGHDVWMDQRLVGGQEWWDEILRNIRECDLFVLALSPKSIVSDACLLELRYATAVRRPFLPAMVLATDPNYLPPEIAHAQFVDYTRSDRDSLLRLVASITQLPPTPPLPDPLPEPPTMPQGPLYEVRRLIALATELDRKHQLWLVDKLQQNSANPQLRPDVTELLAEFRQRNDLMADVLAKVDELLRSLRGDRQPPAPAARPMAWLAVLIAGLLLAVAAAAEVPQTGSSVAYYSAALDIVAIAAIYAFALRKKPRFWGWWLIFSAFALDSLWDLFYQLLERSPVAHAVNLWVGQNGQMALLTIGLLAFRPPWMASRRSVGHAMVAGGIVLLAILVAVKTMPTGYTLTRLGYTEAIVSALIVGAGVWVALERGLAPLLRIGVVAAVLLTYLNEIFVTHNINGANFTVWEVLPWEATAIILASIAAFAAARWPGGQWPAPAPRPRPGRSGAKPPPAASAPSGLSAAAPETSAAAAAPAASGRADEDGVATA